MTIPGSCLCGAVRFEVTGDPLWAHNCHCSRCRKTRGAAFASNLFIGEDGFRYIEGESEVRSYKPPGAERFTHAFCTRCGSSMPWRNESRAMVVVPMGCLDGDPGIEPRANIFVESKATWFAITDALPQSPAAPGS
ncbi:MAG TPA: GFA family protein [Candidatus Limnocylindrales bacterium]|nr:GFA family protein [Candidatus Limnocylindrales bacterium]